MRNCKRSLFCPRKFWRKSSKLSYAKNKKHRQTRPTGESRYSLTVDFAARRTHAREAMQPLLEEAARIKSQAIDLKEQLKRDKKEGKKAKIEALEVEIREREKAARDAESKAAEIDAAGRRLPH